jgi:excisionase family DNA binding protein
MRRQERYAEAAAERAREARGEALPAEADPGRVVPGARRVVEQRTEERAKPPARLCTGKEIAEVLRVHVKTVERWRVKLGLPCLRLGGTIRYELSDVCSWASARKEG